MNTYPTLEEAFVNGSGDCFYQKDDQYVAIHRNDTGKAFDLVCKGWKLMPAGSYPMGRYQRPINQPERVRHSYPLFESYVDEFPDGVNQSL